MLALAELPALAFAFVLVLSRVGAAVMLLPGMGETEVPPIARAVGRSLPAFRHGARACGRRRAAAGARRPREDLTSPWAEGSRATPPPYFAACQRPASRAVKPYMPRKPGIFTSCAANCDLFTFETPL